MIKLSSLLVVESAASDQAKKAGLQYLGFGRYGKDGKTTHISMAGKRLVRVKPKTDTDEPNDDDGFNPYYNDMPSRRVLNHIVKVYENLPDDDYAQKIAEIGENALRKTVASGGNVQALMHVLIQKYKDTQDPKYIHIMGFLAHSTEYNKYQRR